MRETSWDLLTVLYVLSKAPVVPGCAQRYLSGRHICHGTMVFSQPLSPLLYGGHDQAIGVGSALNSSRDMRIGCYSEPILPDIQWFPGIGLEFRMVFIHYAYRL